jgi:hypothetical protein
MTTTYSPINTPTAEDISLPETAKLIRAALKKAFPAVKFQVTTKRYSMGCSITVQFSGDTRTSDVKKITNAFGGKDFDSMLDASYARYAWLAPDGTTSPAYASSCIRGDGRRIFEYSDPHAADCRYVRFGADYVMVQKDFS